MSQREESAPLSSFVQDEMIDCLSKALTGVLFQLNSVARLRLLAFMHLIEDPEGMKAFLEVQPSGSLRLTLEAPVAPCKWHQH